MDTPSSRWEGHLVAAKYNNDNGSFTSYGKKFNLTLSNGARWIPDAKEEYIGKYDSSLPAPLDFQSVVNLKKGGIIDLYGDNRHTGNKGYTNKLTIDNLQAEKGRFIIFSSLDNSKNDMLFIKSGKGTALVEPVDPKELKDVSTEKPILFADVSKTISFEGYDNIETLDDGFLYSYVPVVEKNVLDASSTSSKYGDLWYIVGVTKNETPAIEVPVSDANLYLASATSFLALDTLNKRMGEVRDNGIETSGLWTRVKAGRISSDRNGYFKDNFQFYQIGYDRFIAGENGNWIFGGALHHTESNSIFHYGSGDVDNTGLSGYASWFNEAGCYADLVAKYSWISDNYQVQVGNQSASADYDSHALTLSAEVGKQFILQKSFFVEPQMQLAYTKVEELSYALTNGVGVHQAKVDSLIGRIGVRLGTTFAMPKSEKSGSAYLRLDGYHEFDGDRTIALQGKDSSYAKSINGSDSWMSYGLGVTLPFARTTSFYAEVERSAGGDIQTDWQVNGGLRIQF